MRKSNDTVTFISWNQRPHVLTMNCSFYLQVRVLTLATAHFQFQKLFFSFFFFSTFHVYLWIDSHCQIPSLALLAELNTYSKVTAVTGRRWVFLWKPFLPRISKCISLIYCHMLVKPWFRFFSWHMLLQQLDCSSGVHTDLKEDFLPSWNAVGKTLPMALGAQREHLEKSQNPAIISTSRVLMALPQYLWQLWLLSEITN